MRIVPLVTILTLGLMPLISTAATLHHPAHAHVTITHRIQKESLAQVDGMASAVTDHLWAQTDIIWHHGDYPRMIALDRIITEQDPHFLEPYSVGGWLLDSMGQKADAEAYYKLGVIRNPTSSYAMYQLTMFYFINNRYQDALKYAKREVRLEGADSLDWKLLAHSYDHCGYYNDSIKTWQIIKARFPNEPVAMVNNNINRVKEKLATSVKANTPVITQ